MNGPGAVKQRCTYFTFTFRLSTPNFPLYISYLLWQVKCSSGRQTAASEATYMYRSSDSLLTRTSLILSIFRSSPSMSSTVMVESAMETTSSSEGQRETLELGWAAHSCCPVRRHCAITVPSLRHHSTNAYFMQIKWTNGKKQTNMPPWIWWT